VSRPSRPTRLVVVGAGAGMGRWLSDHVLAPQPWESVLLVDVESAATAVAEATTAYAAGSARAAVPSAASGLTALDGMPLPLGSAAADRTVVVLALPHGQLGPAVGRLEPLLDPDLGAVELVVVAQGMARALAVTRERAPGRAAYGLHPLFDVTARGLDGETAYVVPDAAAPRAHDWLVGMLHGLGGTVRFGTAQEHDATMGLVQALAHQSLLAVATAVAESGLDLHDVWAARTPFFETVFGMAVRALDETQQPVLASLQTSLDGPAAAAALEAASARVRAAVADGDPAAVERLIGKVREHFSGALFETVRGTAVAALGAAQSKRAALAVAMRRGELVGIRPVGRPDSLRVGRIVDVDPVEVRVEELMVGAHGRAALLDGPGRANVARLGLGGKPRVTAFRLGHVDLLTGAELEAELAAWLGEVRRDVRFLVPESVAGSGVLEVVAKAPGVGEAAVVSEVVRTGQRSVVVRVGLRVDHDVDELVETLRGLVARAFAWPQGLSLPLVSDAAAAPVEVTYLGPAGTFSEVAASHLAAALGLHAPRLVPVESFGAVLAAVEAGGVGVLPITSSASGLVTRSVEAILGHDGQLQAGGVVDVAVRFDAYARAADHLEGLRGGTVYSHPQAIAQCQGFIRRWGLTAVPCASTADALRQVATATGPALALAGEGKGAELGLKVIEREVDDLSGSITRFLTLSRPGGFGDLVGGSDPTLRSILVGRDLAEVAAHLGAAGAAYDEVLSDAAGNVLWVTSREQPLAPDAGPVGGLRWLGRAPWSPRTPLVRVGG